MRAQSCPTLWDPMDCSLLGSSVHEDSVQARMLEWIAVPSSRRSSQPRIELRSPALQADFLPSEPLEYLIKSTYWPLLSRLKLKKLSCFQMNFSLILDWKHLVV